MRRILKNTAIVLMTAIAILSSCSGKDGRTVIPRRQLAKIYAEMLVTDQWITSTPGMRMIADTSLVYIPILEKYGYDLDDYLKSVDVYMDDPERFSRILRTSSEIIGKQIKDAEQRLEEYNRIKELPKLVFNLDMGEFFPYLFDEPYVHYYDSLTFEPDSALSIYRLIPVEKNDTLFDGVKIIVNSPEDVAVDTTAVEDTTKVMEENMVSVLNQDIAMKIIPERKIDTTGIKKATRIIKADNPLTAKRKWESKE